MSPEIPDEAVEAACEAVFDHVYRWAELGRPTSCACGEWTSSERSPFAEHVALHAIQAAAPHMVAAATATHGERIATAIETERDRYEFEPSGTRYSALSIAARIAREETP